MKISDALATSRIKKSMMSKNRWEAIEELLDVLIADGTVAGEKRQEVLDALLAREKSISTGIGFGLAIPHAATPSVSKLALALGLSETGINFDALDNKPVYIVVLFLVPSAQYQENLKTLASISRLLNQKSFRDKLRKADSAEAIYELFKSRNL